MPRRQTRPSRLDRVIAAADRLDVTSRWITWVSLGVFVVGAILAFQASDIAWSELRLEWLVLTAVLSTPAILLNASEFRVTGTLVSEFVKLRDALRVAVVSTAANLLPLPGGVIMRAQSLRTTGVARHRTFAAQLGLALIWLAESSLLSAALLVGPESGAAAVFAAIGAFAGLGGAAFIRWLRPQAGVGRSLLLALLIEGLFVISTAARIAAALAALGITPTLGQSVVLASATVLSAFVVVLPAGLGVRELIAAGIAPLVGLSAATGFVVAVIVRLVAMATFGVLALFVVAGKGE